MTAPVAEKAEPAEGDPAATTLLQAFHGIVARRADEVAVRTVDGAAELTFAQLDARAEAVAGALAAHGLGRGDTLALHLANRPEMHVVDLAAMHLGAIPFSIYATSSPEQVAFLLENSDARIVITEEAFLPVVRTAIEGRPDTLVVTVDGAQDGTTSLEELEATPAPDGFDLAAAEAAIDGDDVVTLIYTSGTTGPPKGVELTHLNLLAQCRGVGERIPFRPGARLTSYLPSAHIADRWSCYYSMLVWGIELTTVPDARQVAAALGQVRPTIWGAVPRVLEKLKAALEAGIAAEPDEARRSAVQGAVEAAKARQLRIDAGEQVEDLPAQVEAVLGALRAKIGLDQAEWVIVGASPLAPAVETWLRSLGLPLTQVYGMSEASCCLTCSTVEDARTGTVGQLIGELESKIAEDGELLVRGTTVMRGYRGLPEKTGVTIDADGWLATGDIAEIDPDGHLRIVDRKKELIINAAGKNMSPANIEGVLKEAHPLVGQVVCIGDNRPYNVALLVIDPDAAAARGGVEAVASDEALRAEIAAGVEKANARLSRVEQIKRWELLSEEWLPGGDELTPTMKLRRKPIAEKYAEQIERLYA